MTRVILIFLLTVVGMSPVFAQRYFEFGLRFSQDTENFIAATRDSMQIALAESELLKLESERNLHIHGLLAHGNAGYNLRWNWHFIPDQWRLTEASIEICDGRPSMIPSDTSMWEDSLLFCPYASYVLREFHPTAVERRIDTRELVSIYPNPTRGVFSLDLPAVMNKGHTLQMFNILGQVIHTQSIPISDFGSRLEIDVSDFSSGIYFLRLNLGNRMEIRKIIKQ